METIRNILSAQPHANGNSPSIRIMGVDDHPIVLDGMRSMIETQEDMEMVGEASRASEAIRSVPRVKPDVILMDLNLPGVSGIRATAEIRQAYPSVRVIILTTYCSEEDVRGAIDSGAGGYLLKEALRNEMIAAIRIVHKGGQYLPPECALRLKESMGREPLTQREREVLAHVSNGLPNGEIARILKISHQTVKSHVKSILSKVDAADRTQAILTAIRRGLVHLNDGR